MFKFESQQPEKKNNSAAGCIPTWQWVDLWRSQQRRSAKIQWLWPPWLNRPLELTPTGLVMKFLVSVPGTGVQHWHGPHLLLLVLGQNRSGVADFLGSMKFYTYYTSRRMAHQLYFACKGGIVFTFRVSVNRPIMVPYVIRRRTALVCQRCGASISVVKLWQAGSAANDSLSQQLSMD